jgi:hypothetical protein
MGPSLHVESDASARAKQYAKLAKNLTTVDVIALLVLKLIKTKTTSTVVNFFDRLKTEYVDTYILVLAFDWQL